MTNQLDKDKIQNIFVITVTILIIIFFLAVLFGVKYYYAPMPPEKVKYNGFEFVKKGVLWHMNWQRNEQVYNIGLRYNPSEVEKIPIIGNFSNEFNKKNKIYITFDPFSDNTTFKYQALAASELAAQLAGPLGKQPVAACTKGEQVKACKDRPIVNCDNKDLNVIVIKSEEPTQVLLNQTCITIQGKDLELVKSAEKTLYTWFGIIKNPIVPIRATN